MIHKGRRDNHSEKLKQNAKIFFRRVKTKRRNRKMILIVHNKYTTLKIFALNGF